MPPILSALAFRAQLIKHQLQNMLQLSRWIKAIGATDILRTPLEYVLHPSKVRLQSLGIFMIIGQPTFGLIWTYVYPQPFENLWVRAVFGALGLTLALPKIANSSDSVETQRLCSLIFWLGLPFLFFWMYFCNGGNTVWLVSLCSMVVIYYHLTDWRIASFGIVTGAFLGWSISGTSGIQGASQVQPDYLLHLILFGFCWMSALTLGASSANLRREHIRNSLSTMGIMAHELRTPLATVAMMADALQTVAIDIAKMTDIHESSLKVDRMSSRLHTLTRQMHHQIDTQIANARLLQLPMHEERVSAYDLLNDVIGKYPYRTLRERECVELDIQRDFVFLSSFVQFSQVIDNMMKNAFRALIATDRPLVRGDLRIEVTIKNGRGSISVADKGRGISPDFLPRIFEPFFSTSRGTGHGLGLAFCDQVVRSNQGEISVESFLMIGTRFTISLPLAQNVRHASGATPKKFAKL